MKYDSRKYQMYRNDDLLSILKSTYHEDYLQRFNFDNSHYLSFEMQVFKAFNKSTFYSSSKWIYCQKLKGNTTC